MTSATRTILLMLLAAVLGIALFVGGMFYADRWNTPWSTGMMGGRGYGAMGGYGPGMTGGGGMMEGLGYRNTPGAGPLTEAQVRGAVNSYLAGLGNDDLIVKEIMIFEDNAYAAIAEKSTGIGAFELLVNPADLAVFPEYGPNMMWNLKYGMMGGYGATGMMGSGFGPGSMMPGYASPGSVPPPTVTADMPVTAVQAALAAQKYLDLYLPGVTTAAEITPFYGYYTLDTERDGATVGMLSVNGYNGQVFMHTWHGRFISMIEE